MSAGQIRLHLVKSGALIRGQFKTQLREELVPKCMSGLQRKARFRPVSFANLAQAEMVSQHFFKRQSPLARMCSTRQAGYIRIFGGLMQIGNGFPGGRQIVFGHNIGR